jgi:hypothetical protein
MRKIYGREKPQRKRDHNSFIAVSRLSSFSPAVNTTTEKTKLGDIKLKLFLSFEASSKRRKGEGDEKPMMTKKKRVEISICHSKRETKN